MGRVYRALDPSLGREVAIKALPTPSVATRRACVASSGRRASSATLSHPNIASIYGFERLGGSPYLVLERVDGETLSQRLAARPVPSGSRRRGASDHRGLQEAHAKGVTHRDLKPSNVMLAPSGRAKLVDFGFAKTATKPAEADPSLEPITEAGAVVGTARYMSPSRYTATKSTRAPMSGPSDASSTRCLRASGLPRPVGAGGAGRGAARRSGLERASRRCAASHPAAPAALSATRPAIEAAAHRRRAPRFGGADE